MEFTCPKISMCRRRSEIAETLDYIRNSWGNAAKPVDEKEVARMRATLQAAEQLPAN
jgi:hypothetical protein